MKLNYTKILLFFFPLNILVTSYHAHNNKNKPSITPRHTQRYTSRVLSECHIQSSIYDNDEEMKSVKENFDRHTSQRFDKYEERMKGKRQKSKEERDKSIQEIIEKDRKDKLLAQKVEKGCLRCACGLGGVAASVGLFGGLGIYGWKTTATATAMELAKEAAEQAGVAAAAKAGKNAVIAGLKEFGVEKIADQSLVSYFITTEYTNVRNIARAISIEYQTDLCLFGGSGSGADKSKTICTWVRANFFAAKDSPGNVSKQGVSTNALIQEAVETIVSNAKNAAGEASKEATEEVIKTSTVAVESTYASCQTAIIASVVAILIIVLVMIIIYLVLRYRRKKKMNKKLQYTKLLNQ
ncbi:hypothetical protein PFFVO_01243 [Plasmodium falciparum Vietnam Oak-Knoll (FVO)]|uniref:Surface antigen n=1 Tax=Plasmodium falciparum Vietnam Oak-Knoll (FVO) TaxID=1036723 RepID=A0A024VBB0_PLAFA|nr:hypothetical protein PFFVO_01243 [Plasmodium falciparum Vietnam Oak-Knoll (FVO)]